MLQITKDHTSGNYKASLPYMPVINRIDHCTAVPCPFNLTRVIQPYRSLQRARSIQRGIFNCGVHGNVALKLSPREICHLQLFNLRHYLKSGQTWTIYGL